MHILPNISISKDNQAMKFGQLIKYNMKTFFLKNHTQNMVESLFPNRFLNIQSLYQKFCIVCFYCMTSWELLKLPL